MNACASSRNQDYSFFAKSTFSLPHHKIQLRPLKHTDILKLEWHGGADLHSFYQKQWDEHDAGNVLVIVADFNNFPVAQAAIHCLGKPTNPHIPDIQSLRVMEAFQGQGIGSKMLELCESIVQANGYSAVSLAVALDNQRAKHLYQRLKYRSTGNAYEDKWSYTDTKGRTVQVSELVTDMIKDL